MRTDILSLTQPFPIMRQGAEIDAEILHHLGHVGLHSGARHGQGVAGESRIGVANRRSAFTGLGCAEVGMDWGVVALMPPTYSSKRSIVRSIVVSSWKGRAKAYQTAIGDLDVDQAVRGAR